MPLLALAAIAPNPRQPRKTFPEQSLRELALSIRENGVLEPLIVRPPDGLGLHLLVAGERRYRACKLIELEQVPAVIHDFDDDALAIASLVENLQRENVPPIEEAMAMQALIDRGMAVSELARRLGIDQAMRLMQSLELLKLAPKLREAVDRRWITRGQALDIARLPPLEQNRLFMLVMLGKIKGVGGIRQAVQAIMDRDAQGVLLQRPRQNATDEQQRAIGRFERRVEAVASVAALGFDREGAVDILRQVRPEHASHVADRVDLVVKHFQMLARELRRAAVQYEISAAATEEQ